VPGAGTPRRSGSLRFSLRVIPVVTRARHLRCRQGPKRVSLGVARSARSNDEVSVRISPRRHRSFLEDLIDPGEYMMHTSPCRLETVVPHVRKLRCCIELGPQAVRGSALSVRGHLADRGIGGL